MADKLFSLLRKERERLELAIQRAEARGESGKPDVRRLKALHRAVNDQIQSWMRDLYGDDLDTLRTAA